MAKHTFKLTDKIYKTDFNNYLDIRFKCIGNTADMTGTISNKENVTHKWISSALTLMYPVWVSFGVSLDGIL